MILLKSLLDQSDSNQQNQKDKKKKYIAKKRTSNNNDNNDNNNDDGEGDGGNNIENNNLQGANGGYAWQDEIKRSWDLVTVDKEADMTALVVSIIEARKKCAAKREMSFHFNVVLLEH